MIGDRDSTFWSRLHARQAFVLGLLASLGYVLVLALPLLVVILVPEITTGGTVILYGVALVVDLIAGLALFIVATRYYGQALRGELFSVPLVSGLVDRWFRLERK